MNPKCIACEKTVYPVEMVSLDEKVLHKQCFRCAHCKSLLSAGKYAALGGKYYCKPHFKQLFALKGNYSGGFETENQSSTISSSFSPSSSSSSASATASSTVVSKPVSTHEAGNGAESSYADIRSKLKSSKAVQPSSDNGTKSSSAENTSAISSSTANYEPAATNATINGESDEKRAELLVNPENNLADNLANNTAESAPASDNKEMTTQANNTAAPQADIASESSNKEMKTSASGVLLENNSVADLKAVIKVSDRVANSIENLRSSRENLGKSNSREQLTDAKPESAPRVNKVADRYTVGSQTNGAASDNNRPGRGNLQRTGSNSVIGKFANLGGGPSTKCTSCDKTVYPVEQLNVESKIFHKLCFRCAHCNNLIKLGNYAALDGKYFCKPHFKQLFALKGNYNSGFGTAEHKEKWSHKDGNQVPV